MTMFSEDNDRLDTGPDSVALAQCETVCEVIVVAHYLIALEGVDKLLDQILPISFREQLRAEADEVARVGLKPLAKLIRRHALRARPAPERDWWLIPDEDKRKAAFARQGGEGWRRTRANQPD
jgi:hypothetical protein